MGSSARSILLRMVSLPTFRPGSTIGEGIMGSLVNVSANTFALAYHGYRDHQNSGYSWGHKIITFSVDDDGKNFKGIATLHHDKETSSNVGYGADFVKIDEDSYALAYRTYN